MRNNSRDAILNNIKNTFGSVDTDYGYADSIFKDKELLSETDPSELIEEFSDKLISLNGNVELMVNYNQVLNAIDKIFKKTRSENFFGWKSEYLTPIYKKLEKRGYKYLSSTAKNRQSSCDAGITLADYAISETGTIVVYANRIQNRNSSLIAPIHIAIVDKDKIVKNIFDLFDTIYNDYSKIGDIRDLSDCISFITGPSRTADIELNLTLGVHGPRELYVLIIKTTN